MNDSLSFSDNSTPSSSNHSNSNSLNRSSVTSSLYGGATDFFPYHHLNATIAIPKAKKRSNSLVSNYRDYFDQNVKKYKDELIDAKKMMKEKDEIIDKLTDIRNKLESEIRELTACLFEQAYAMVNTAKDETAQSNKLLNEANGKIDVLEAEVKALKALVLTSTPSEPNKHLHPQLNMMNNTSNNLLLTPNKTNNNSKSTHKRAPSHNEAMKNYHEHFQQQLRQLELGMKTSDESNSSITCALKCEFYEIDPIYFKEIVLWRENPHFDLDNLFISRVYTEDIVPCINFNNKELVNELLNAIKSNCVCIEDISNSHPIETMQVCSLSNVPSICQYKLKLNDTSTSQWYLISKLCRNRITSVCDFFTYLRYIKDGLVKSDNRDVYWTMIDLRRRMSLSRLGL